jgi:hypothetical protein
MTRIARCQIEVFPSMMGNLLLRFCVDVLGRLRKSSSSSEPGSLPRWAWPTCFPIGRAHSNETHRQGPLKSPYLVRFIPNVG